MPTLYTSRKKLSETVKAISKFATEHAVNFNYALVDVKGTATIEPIGTPVVWDDTDAFEVYVDQDVTALTTASSLPNEAATAITVGTYAYVGENEADVTLSTTATKMWVLYRGDAAVVESGIEWATGSAAGDKAAFRVLLEKAGITVVDDATAAAPSVG